MEKEKKAENFKSKTITDFYNEYGKEPLTNFNIDEKTKLCSSNDFDQVVQSFLEKNWLGKTANLIGTADDFYLLATLAAISTRLSTNDTEIADTLPDQKASNLLLFDKNSNNIKIAIFNTLLMQLCDKKEDYITSLFGMTNSDIFKIMESSKYKSVMIDQIKKDIYSSMEDSSEKNRMAKFYLTNGNPEELAKIEQSDSLKQYFTDEYRESILSIYAFNIDAIKNYAVKKEYNKEEHYAYLENLAKTKLAAGQISQEMYDLFIKLANGITSYLANDNNYKVLVKNLSNNMNNNIKHVLNNKDYYNSFKKIIKKNGQGTIKFVDNIDISKKGSSEELENILRQEKIIKDKDDYSIDIAVVPQIHSYKSAYPFIKRNVQNYIMLNKNKKDSGKYIMESTATLDLKNYNTMGAEFIEKERKSRVPLKHLSKINSNPGYPKLGFIAGADFGNIYHSENDTKNMIDMAIADGVDTMYIQGLFYATYNHHQTSRRDLKDPKYDTLDSRLKAAKRLIKKLNKGGVRVVYQLGDEETNLYHDIFKMYIKEQKIVGNNFLARDDLRMEYDWVKPIIIQYLIPYMIRKGEDVINISSDNCKNTNITQMCNAIKRYIDGQPLGDLKEYIDVKYLKDTELFEVVHSKLDVFDKNDSALSVNLLANPNFSHITQYGNPTAAVVKRLKLYQSGAVGNYTKDTIPQLNVDAREGAMSLQFHGQQATLNVPQMINDEYYIDHKELLPGTKEKIQEDPTHKRVTQSQTKPNFPGGWIICGDEREIMTSIPYFKRMKEVMNYVQKTGEGLPELNVLHINDTQLGSITERLEYMIKMLDYAFYHYNIRGIWGNGDFTQGWNYPAFANESRHTAAASVTQQMISFIKLQEPWLKEAFGVVKNDAFEGEYDDFKIDFTTNCEIIKFLIDNNFIKKQNGLVGTVFTIDKGIDYKNVNYNLPLNLQPYEKLIREKLSNIHQLWFYHLVEGNHESNTDWNNKGYNEIEHIRQHLNTMKEALGDNELETSLTEYFVNGQGDYVKSPYGFKSINGYNVVYAHSFRAPGKGSGGSPTMAMANYFQSLEEESNKVDWAFMGHLHIFEASVYNNKLLTVTGCSAGQSGYEQNLGYRSHPLFVVDRFLPDGRIAIDTIGTKFLDDYEIQNSYVKAMGIDNFIQSCLTEEATISDDEMPKNIHKIYQRKIDIKTVNRKIGPNIKRNNN